MGNYDTTKQEVKNYIFARVPLVVIQSSERERAEKLLREIVREMNIELAYYTEIRQVCSLGTDVTKDVQGDPLLFAADLFRKKKGATFAIGDAKRLSDENSYTRELLNVIYLAMEQVGTIVLITPDPIWPRLAQFGLTTKLDYPDEQERLAQIRRFIGRYQGRFAIEWDESDCSRAGALLGGFSEVQIENILSSALVTSRGLKKEELYELTKQKSRLYAAVPCVDEVRVSHSLETAGLQNLKKWLRERKKLFFVPDEVLRQYDLESPKGILLAGVPGCGKSLSAKMTAKEWELPLFRFDIGGIYDKWVGESERKMREALEFIDHVAPCVVWIDEIEKALAVSDSGNDTGRRIMGQFLFWLQESSSRVFLVATANNVDQLPSELFRKGRFSEIFFLDLPDSEERRAAIRLYSSRSLHMEWSEEELDELAAAAKGFSYSDIEFVIKEAAQAVLLTGQEITREWMTELFRSAIPFSGTNPKTVEEIRKWGRNRAVPAS